MRGYPLGHRVRGAPQGRLASLTSPFASETESVPDVGMSLALGSTQRTAIASARLAPVPTERRLPKHLAVGRWHRSKSRAQAASEARSAFLVGEQALPARLCVDVIVSLSCSMLPALRRRG